MPKQLNNGAITQALQRAFGFKGRYIPMLDEVIVPVYNIEDPVPAEPAQTYGVAVLVPAATIIDDQMVAQMRNPVGSGVVCAINSISAGFLKGVGPPTDTGVFNVLVIPAETAAFDFLSSFPGQNRDTRSGVPSRTVITAGQTSTPVVNRLRSAVAITDLAFAEMVSAGQAPSRQTGIVLAPGFACQVVATGDDVVGATGPSAIVNFGWSEVGVLDQTRA